MVKRNPLIMEKGGTHSTFFYRMGDLDPWMDETFLKQLWLSYGENVIVKLIRDKRTRYTDTQCFYIIHQHKFIASAADMHLSGFHLLYLLRKHWQRFMELEFRIH